MAQPSNYSLNLPDPTQSIMAGAGNALQLAGVIQSFQANEAALSKAQAAAERQKQMQADFGALYDNPTIDSVNKISIKYPEMSEHLDRIHGNISEAEKTERMGQGFKFSAALTSDDPEEAVRMAQEQAVAYRNKGMEAEAKEMEDLSTLVKTDRKQAVLNTNMMLSRLAGPEKAAETLAKLEAERRLRGLEGAELTAAQAKAHTAAVESEFALSNAVMEQQKKGWDITKIMLDHDIAKENSRIAALNAATAKESNEIKREDLALQAQQAKIKREDLIRERTAEVVAGRTDVDELLNLIADIKKTPNDTMRAAMGGIDSMVKTVQPDVLAFERKLETLQAKQFLTQAEKLKGAVSNADKEAIENERGNLRLDNDWRALMSTLDNMERVGYKVRKNIGAKYGIPDDVPDVPNLKPDDADFDAIMQQYQAPGVSEQ